MVKAIADQMKVATRDQHFSLIVYFNLKDTSSQYEPSLAVSKCAVVERTARPFKSIAVGMEWVRPNIGEALHVDGFSNVIWSDESTIQCIAGFVATSKENCPGYVSYMRLNMNFQFRTKHPVKVHIWAGLSMCGLTEICIFEGIIKAPLLHSRTLLPFIQDTCPGG